MSQPQGGTLLDKAFDSLKLCERTRDSIRARYGEPQRHYHTTHHLEAMLAALPSEHNFLNEMLAATLYHDIVYDPTRSDNEERSAAVFDAESGAASLDGLVDTSLVVEMILATKGHAFRAKDDPRSEAINLLLKADLSVLWHANPAIYAWYAAGVRKEYGFVPEDRFGEARSRVLTGLRDDLLASGKLTDDEAIRLRNNLATELG